LSYSSLRNSALLLLLLAMPAAWWVGQLSVDNRQEKLVNQSGRAAQLYRQFKQDFGHDEFVIMALSGREIFAWETLDDMLALVDSLEAIDEIASVNGVPVIYRDLFGEEDVEALEYEMTATPFYRNLLLSGDGQVAGLMLRLKELGSVAERRRLVEAIELVAAQAHELGFRVDLVGQPIFSVAINRITSQETSRTFPIAGIAALVILLFLLRSIRASLVVLVGGGASLLYTLAVVSLLGWELNLITTSLPLVLFVLSIANGIHIASRYQRILNEVPDRRLAMQRTQRELAVSCVLSSITTALGFLSLMVADLQAIFQMGIYMSLGILFSLLVNFTLGAWLLVVSGASAASGAGRQLGHWLRRRVDFSMRRPIVVVVAFALVAVAGVAAIGRISASGDGQQFLPEGHPLTASYAFVSEHLTGVTALELVVTMPGGWLQDSYWPAMQSLVADLEALDGVRRVYSPLSVLSKMNQWHRGGDPADYGLPASTVAAQEILALLEGSTREELSSYATADGERIRLSILADLQGEQRTSDLVAAVESSAAQLPHPLTAQVTGLSVQMTALSEGLLATQLKSYGLAFMLIFTTIAFGLRSRHLLLLSILPNIMPMLVIFLLMWSLSIPLNAATVMVASISLGIAVDNTVHFLNRFRKQRHGGDTALQAAENTIVQVGPSITISTVTACIGFYALLPSVFEPISNLGLLAGSAILAALVSNLLFLPATIALSPVEKHDAYS
jgi:predicted RND superfamily exporter protein